MKQQEETQSDELILVSDSCLTVYVTSKEVAEYLFPSGRIIVDYVPFKLLASNVKLMRAPNNFTQMFSDVRLDDGKPVGLLSIGTFYSAKNSTGLCIMELYGTDVSSLKSHVAVHLKRVSQLVSSASNITLYIDKRIPSVEVDGVFSGFGLTRFTWQDPNTGETGYTDHFLFEKQLL